MGRGIRRADVQAATPEVRCAALDGADVERIKLYWKLRAPRDVHTIWRSCCEAAASWRASVRGSPCERQALEAASEEASAPVLAMPPLRIPEAYRAYAARLPRPRPHQVLVVEDKDTAAAWMCSRAAYANRCEHYFEMGDAWQRTDMTVEQAAAWTRQLHAPLVQEGVLRPTSLDAWRTSLPSAYTIMKSNCWQTGAHTCMRESHSCVRRICSWSRWPYRRELRLAGLAWRLALVQLGAGDSTRSMAHSGRDLRSRHELLNPAPDTRPCRGCGGRRPRRCAVVMDASAMHEQIECPQVLRAARFVVEATNEVRAESFCTTPGPSKARRGATVARTGRTRRSCRSSACTPSSRPGYCLAL